MTFELFFPTENDCFAPVPLCLLVVVVFTYMICGKSFALLLYLLKNNYRLMCIHIIMGGVGGILTGLPEKVCRYSGLFLLKTNSTSTSKGRECQAVSSMIINVSSYFIKYARLSTVD